MTMRKHTLALVLVLSVVALPIVAIAGPMETVPGGTSVGVKVVDPISSSSANVGDVFQIKAAQDVVVDGWIVIPKDSPGQGEVMTVDRAGSHGHAGSLGLQFDWVYSADGGKIRLSNVKSSTQGQGSGGASSTATIASYVLLGPIGLFTHNFVKGKDVTIDSTRTIMIYVDSTVHVATKQKPAPATGFDH
jgi:hypothetical protein